MRLLRTLIPLAKKGWYPMGEYCRAIQISYSRKHHVLVERLNRVHCPRMRWFLKSYATSASSDTVEGREFGVKISRNERKARVETYVRKYREMNSGKFLTPSFAQKEAGGSYYVVREIIQKLQYKCNMPSFDNTEPENRDVYNQALPRENISSIPKAESRQSRSKGYHLKQDKSKSDGTQPTASLASKNNATLKAVMESKFASQQLQPKSIPEDSDASEGSKGTCTKNTMKLQNLKVNPQFGRA